MANERRNTATVTEGPIGPDVPTIPYADRQKHNHKEIVTAVRRFRVQAVGIDPIEVEAANAADATRAFNAKPKGDPAKATAYAQRQLQIVEIG